MRQARDFTRTGYHGYEREPGNAEEPDTQKVGELAPEPLPVPSSPTIETQAPPPSSACVPSHLTHLRPTLFAVCYCKSLARLERAYFAGKVTDRRDNMSPTDERRSRMLRLRTADAEFAHAVIEGRAIHAEASGGATRTADYPTRFSEHAEYVIAFDGFECR